LGSFKQAIQINPELRMAHIRLADLYREQGDYSDAAAQYQIAAKLDPYSAENDYNLGVCYQFLHRLADAAAAYLRALDLQPGNERANTNLGLVYLALGKPVDALAYLKRATELSPTSAQAWSNYGVGLDAAGQLAQGQQAYERALELDNNSASTLENLAANLIAQRKAEQAIAVCQQLLLRSDGALSRVRYAQALALSGNDAGAMQQFKLALQRDPRSSMALSAEAFVLIDEYRSGMELDEPKRQAALDLWKQSLDLNPNQPQTRAAFEQWQSAELFSK
jgi:tetratricopeptide (TPR) repeat protein